LLWRECYKLLLCLRNRETDDIKALLTAKADDKTKQQNQPNPEFTISYTGFANGENKSVLDVLPTIQCAANLNSPIGFYTISVVGGSDNNYEIDQKSGTLTILSITGIEEIKSDFSVYPNPAKHDLFIKSDTPVEKVEIYNLSGLRVLSEDNVAEKIDVSHLDDGVYFVRVYVDGTAFTKKIVVKK
jgi:hypothetical protein